MYVLPFGQMSLWGATVITNLLSAIPWLGKSLVEWIIITKLYLMFFLYLIFFRENTYLHLFHIFWSLENIIINKYLLYRNNIKTYINEIIYKNRLDVLFSNSLITIGKISPNAFKKGRKHILDKSKFLNIPYSFLSMLIGLIDGDGHISITETSKGYIKIYLVLSLNIRDLPLLQYINSIIDIGKVNSYPKFKVKDTCKLVINKTDLQDIFFPLMKYHNLFFITKERRKQYDKALYIMENNIIFYKDIPDNILTYNPLLLKSKDYMKLKYFNNWIVGFTIAEGSFLVKNNNDACFQLRQRVDINLFEALKRVFMTNRKIGLDKNNLYCMLSVSSKTDIQNVINYFSFSGNHPLLGYQLIRYEKWLQYLKRSNRYQDLKYSIYI